MAFDKEKYRENRERGLRGQGEKHKTSVTTPNHYKASNRQTERRKYDDFRATTKTTLGQRRTKEESLAIHARVRRTEAGEQQRIAKKKAALAAAREVV